MSRYEVEIKINMNDDWGMYECKNTANIELTDFICRVRDIIGDNPHYNVLTPLPETSEQSSLCATTKVVFDDNSGYFPGILTEKHLIAYDPEDGPMISNYEVHVRANDEADCMKVAHFMHYQFAGRQSYVGSKVFLSIDDDKKGVLLIVDGELCDRPLIVPIADDFVIKASELY